MDTFDFYFIHFFSINTGRRLQVCCSAWHGVPAGKGDQVWTSQVISERPQPPDVSVTYGVRGERAGPRKLASRPRGKQIANLTYLVKVLYT